VLVGGFLLSGRDQVNKVDSSRGSRFLSLPFPMTQSVSRRVCRAILTHCLRPGKDYQVAGQSKPGDRGPEKNIRAASAAPRAGVDVERTGQKNSRSAREHCVAHTGFGPGAGELSLQNSGEN
jgi:hypothetical protein